MVFQVIRMASAEVLQRVRSKAAQADMLISQLKTHVDLLKKAQASSVVELAEKKLRDENDKLREEIDTLRTQLVLTEISHGVRQVYVTTQKSVLPPATLEKPATASPVVPAKAEGEPQEKRFKQAVKTTDGEPEKKRQRPNENIETNVKEESPIQENQSANESKPTKESKPAKAAKSTPPSDAGPIDVSRLDMRIGRIVQCEKHPDAESLYVEQVDLAEGKTRTIVSGLVKFVPIEQMQNKLAVFMCNLKPAKMRGILSEGMIMCASNQPHAVEILDVPADCVPGDRVIVDGYTGEPDKLLNPKKKVWEQIKPDLKVDDSGLATYKGATWRVEGKGVIKSPNITNVQIS